MYYEEEVFDGVTMYRTSPNGDWKPVPNSEMTDRIKQNKEEIAALTARVEELKAKLVDVGEWAQALPIDIDGESLVAAKDWDDLDRILAAKEV